VQSHLPLPKLETRESCLIRSIFLKHLNEFYSEKNNFERIPNFVKKEVDDFLKCGVLAHGFIRLFCKNCQSTQTLAFSCKRRGFCPSCLARRMNDSAIFLDERVFPEKPVRQWVLSFPFFIRYLMAYDPKIVTAILRIHNQVIARWYKKKSSLNQKDLKVGAVSVVQRFGGALNVNPHFHSLFVDGYYYKDSAKLKFQKSRQPSQKEMEDLLKLIVKRTIRLLTKKAYIEADFVGEGILSNPLSDLHSQSVVYRIAVGKRSGEKVQLYGYELEEPKRNSSGGVSLMGFNIHAGVFIRGYDREKLQGLCRYILRGPISRQRLIKVSDDKVAIRFKKMWSSGATHVVYSNIEFIEKLVALVPPARANLVRYHGFFAPNSKWRKEIVRDPASKKDKKVSNPNRLSWAELMKRTFGIDPERCKKCGSKLKAIAIIKYGPLVQEILSSLGITSYPVKLRQLLKARPAKLPINI